ncbi:response regulator, partial [Thermodesulfobacteriota bacterium]
SHDFNNILQVISGYTQILLMSKTKEDPEYEMLDTIENSVRMASDLTKRLLIFSRKVESELKPIDLNQLVVQVSKMLERTIPKMITIELHLTGNPKTINADTGQIEQILMNLGVNARDAMPDGGKLIFKTKNERLDENHWKNYLAPKTGEYVMLSVSDNGHGMDQEMLEHVFEPFFTTKEIGKGSGLGLAMVYGIVKSHNAHITCDSMPGEGTTFNIYFPIAETESKKSAAEDAIRLIRGGDETILLVDDDEKIRDLGEETLSRFGYKVFTADDGESALEFYKQKYDLVDLIILDLNMPGMGGAQCLKQLMQINPRSKVVIASGYALNAPTKEIIDYNAMGYVSKPYNLHHMLEVIRTVLNAD